MIGGGAGDVHRTGGGFGFHENPLAVEADDRVVAVRGHRHLPHHGAGQGVDHQFIGAVGVGLPGREIDGLAIRSDVAAIDPRPVQHFVPQHAVSQQVDRGQVALKVPVVHDVEAMRRRGGGGAPHIGTAGEDGGRVHKAVAVIHVVDADGAVIPGRVDEPAVGRCPGDRGEGDAAAGADHQHAHQRQERRPHGEGCYTTPECRHSCPHSGAKTARTSS